MSTVDLKKIAFAIGAIILVHGSTIAQGVLIGANNGTPEPSSVLELRSNTQGFLSPRLTTAERDAIETPAEGLRIYNLDSQCENFYNGNTWVSLCGGCSPQPPQSLAGPDQLNVTGNTLSLSATRHNGNN